MMKIPIARIAALLFLISFFCRLGAQQLTGLEYNSAIKQQLENKVSFKSAEDAPEPPAGNLFFDDFSFYQNSVFPNQSLWSDKCAFINQTYPDSCISIGVATLDAIDSKGNIYAIDDSPTPSDTLTSREVDLSGQTKNVYLSFFVEGGGKGDAPEKKDTLIVEFYNSRPSSQKWAKAWFSYGYESHSFKQVILPIDSIYRTDSFRFRFRNYTSLITRDTKTRLESALGNSDLWNLDYVQIRAADDTNEMKVINDVAITGPLLSAFEDYCSIPYNHFEVATSYSRTVYPFVVRTIFPNLNKEIKITRNYESYNVYKGLKDLQDEAHAIQNSQPPYNEVTYYDNDFFLPNYFYYQNQNYGHYKTVAYIQVGDVSQYHWNDTVKRDEYFKDYYALDDGTAEYGFGLPGNGGYGTQLADMFNLYTYNTQDTLTAIDVNFVHSRNNANKNIEFSLCVWKNDGDNPGELIYPVGDVSDWPVYSVDTTLGINDFKRFELNQDLIVSDTIFIGLVQMGTDFLNIGYDINDNSLSRIRVNNGTGWYTPYSTIPPGSVMMRPVFGHKAYDKVKEIIKTTGQNIRVYPNPATDYITVVPENYSGNSNDYRISVLNVLGQTVADGFRPDQAVSTSALISGIYFVKVVYLPANSVSIQKFLKSE